MNEADVAKTALTKDSESPELTPEQFKASLPPQMRSRVTVGVMRKINDALGDSVATEHIRDNMVGYVSVLQQGKYKLSSYIDAVKYVSYKLLGYTNQESYSKTFPNRITTLLSEGATEKTISAYVATYNKNKLVNAIWEQTLIPSYILNADAYQKAVNKQILLMSTAKSEKVQTDAADSLLKHLKPPENTKVELDIGLKDNGTIRDLRNSIVALTEKQKELIQNNQLTPIEAAHSKLSIDKESAETIEVIE